MQMWNSFHIQTLLNWLAYFQAVIQKDRTKMNKLQSGTITTEQLNQHLKNNQTLEIILSKTNQPLTKEIIETLKSSRQIIKRLSRHRPCHFQ